MSQDKVLFEVDGQLVDGWGNYHGDPEDISLDPPMTQRESIANATANNTGEGPQYATNKELDDMTGEELKGELKLRREAGRTIETTGISRVGDLRDVLKADNAAAAG